MCKRVLHRGVFDNECNGMSGHEQSTIDKKSLGKIKITL
jgi:hypothetical protein